MPPLTAQQILAASDLPPPRRVEVPEWGEGAYVLVRTLTANQRDEWENWISKARHRDNIVGIRAKLCVLAICDEQGNRIFDDKQMAELGSKSVVPIDRIWDAARDANALSAKDVKELEKNSESGPGDSSPTG
jgi:hypothetical protein